MILFWPVVTNAPEVMIAPAMSAVFDQYPKPSGRGFARTKAGDIKRGKADMAAGKSGDENVATEFARYGLQ